MEKTVVETVRYWLSLKDKLKGSRDLPGGGVTPIEDMIAKNAEEWLRGMLKEYDKVSSDYSASLWEK
jgi:hypothetical protein